MTADKPKRGKEKAQVRSQKSCRFFSAVFDHHHHSEDQAGTYTVGPADALLRTHNPVGRGIFEDSSLEPFKLEINQSFICIISFLFFLNIGL